MEENKWKKWLFNEVSLFVGMIAIVVSFITYFNSPVEQLRLEYVQIKADVAELKTNAKRVEDDIAVHLISMQIQLDRVEQRQIQVLQDLAALKSK